MLNLILYKFLESWTDFKRINDPNLPNPCEDFHGYVCSNCKQRDQWEPSEILSDAFARVQINNQTPAAVRFVSNIYKSCIKKIEKAAEFCQSYNELNFQVKTKEYELCIRVRRYLAQCAEDIQDNHGLAVSRIYLDYMIHLQGRNWDDLIGNITSVIAILKSSYRSSIQQAVWLDEVSRTKALTKFDAINYVIGYSKLAFNDSLLDAIYGFPHNLPIAGSEFTETLEKIRASKEKIIAENFGYPFNM